MSVLDQHPSARYVLPFLVFLILLAVSPLLPISPGVQAVVRVGILAVVIGTVAWPVLDFRVSHLAGSVAVGIAVYLIWVGPDVLWPTYRSHWLFQNGLMGKIASSVPDEARHDGLVISLRFVRGALIVPIVEELFWRGWLPRWIDDPSDFMSRPLGQFSRFAFWSTAVLFAVEHGSFWEVGLIAGLVYNWWITRTKSLGDAILAHGVTNACLGVHVLVLGRWEYW
ncbi:MAG: CAAX prenyl protease-related protein [Gemmatimonadota bacterium]